MQAVMNHSSALENFLFASGRDYMMRSEKRSGSGPAHRSPSGGKPPRRRRKRAGFFYKLFMMILLLTIWPLGLLMLWRRKVRWGVVTKLLTPRLLQFLQMRDSQVPPDLVIPISKAIVNEFNTDFRISSSLSLEHPFQQK